MTMFKFSVVVILALVMAVLILSGAVWDSLLTLGRSF